MPVKQQIGIVISNKMQKTIVVKVENRYPHPIYSKTLVKTKKYGPAHIILALHNTNFNTSKAFLYYLKII